MQNTHEQSVKYLIIFCHPPSQLVFISLSLFSLCTSLRRPHSNTSFEIQHNRYCLPFAFWCTCIKSALFRRDGLEKKEGQTTELRTLNSVQTALELWKQLLRVKSYFQFNSSTDKQVNPACPHVQEYRGEYTKDPLGSMFKKRISGLMNGWVGGWLNRWMDGYRAVFKIQFL